MATTSPVGNKKSAKILKRRSTFGVRESLPTQSNELQININPLQVSGIDRVKYRYHATHLEETNEFDEDFLQLIMKNTWSVYRMCYFPEIDFNAAKLKYYASKIRQELVNELLNENPDTVFTVKTFKLPVFQDSDVGGLRIEVRVAKNSAQPRLQYTGLIFSVDDENPDINSEMKPILLSAGAVNISRVVVNAVTTLFDFVLNRLGLSEDDVMWLGAMLSESEENESKPVLYDFLYINAEMPNLLSVSIPSKLLKELWSIIHLADSEEITYNEVYTFHKQIQCQLTALYGIKFEMLTFKKISLQNSEITRDGKIKMKTKESVSKIIYFINDIATLS